MIKAPKKIFCVITSRASYSRVKSALLAMIERRLDISVILSASATTTKYGKLEQNIQSEGIPITAITTNLFETGSVVDMARTVSMSIMDLTGIFQSQSPAAVITIADRYETIATSISASYMNIPLIHIQGGEDTGNIDDKVRNANTMLADYHFVSNKAAKERLVQYGRSKEHIFNVGCPSIDLAYKAINDDKNSNIQVVLDNKGSGDQIDLREDFLVVLYHPVTSHYESAGVEIEELFLALKKIDLPVIWFWPNSDLGSDIVNKALRSYTKSLRKIRYIRNLDGSDFIRLLNLSRCLIGNSSAGIRECSSLGLPVVNIGDRQIGRIRGKNVIDTTEDERDIINATQFQLSHGRYTKDNIFGDGLAGVKIAEKILDLNFS